MARVVVIVDRLLGQRDVTGGVYFSQVPPSRETSGESTKRKESSRDSLSVIIFRFILYRNDKCAGLCPPLFPVYSYLVRLMA